MDNIFYNSLTNSISRSPNGSKGSRSEAEEGRGKSRVDRSRRKTVAPLLKPTTSLSPSAEQATGTTKNSATTRGTEPTREIVKPAEVPDLPEGRTLLEVGQ